MIDALIQSIVSAINKGLAYEYLIVKGHHQISLPTWCYYRYIFTKNRATISKNDRQKRSFMMEYLEGENRFYVPSAQGEQDIAEMTFQRQGDNLAIIDHTYVNINYRGQGIADRLFDLVVDKMRKEGRKIVPRCSFAQKQFDRKPSCQDILAEL